MKSKKQWLLLEGILALLALTVAMEMFQKKSGDTQEKISVLISESEDAQWSAFKYGLKMAAEDMKTEICMVNVSENLTEMEEETLLNQEIENGADGIILQPSLGEKEEKSLRKVQKKNSFDIDGRCDRRRKIFSGSLSESIPVGAGFGQ